MSERMSRLLLASKKHSVLTRPIVYAQSLVVIGTFFWVPYLIYYLMKKYKTTKQRAITLLALIFIIIVPIKKNFWIQNLFVWDHFARYFQTKIVGTPFSRKQTVFGIIPHGIVPLTLGKSSSKLFFFLLLVLFLFSNSFLFIFIFLFAFFQEEFYLFLSNL